MTQTLGVYKASLLAQKHVRQTSTQLARSMARLSSGLRINTASDDAAGLALAGEMEVKSLVLGQAVKNISEGISSVTLADAALSELKNIVQRQLELAEQAASGSHTHAHRALMHEEAAALVTEFNRIIDSTEFNGRNLLDGTLSHFSIQAGAGAYNVIGLNISEELARTVGTGSIQGVTSFSVGGAGTLDITLGDLNGDDLLDLINVGYNGNLSVRLGQGNGTFGNAVTYTLGSRELHSVAVGDIDGDGNVDVVAKGAAILGLYTSYVYVYFGDGSGSLSTVVSHALGSGDFGDGDGLDLGDLDGDGDLDIVTSSTNTATTGYVAVLAANGDGSFKAAATYMETFVTAATDLQLGDFNNDGVLDTLNRNTTGYSLRFGNGDGTFSAADSVSGGGSFETVARDVNFDGNFDIISVGNGTFVQLGNGDGTFKVQTSHSNTIAGSSLAIADLDGDGILDIAVGGNSFGQRVALSLGNGDGTFRVATSYAADGGSTAIAIGDLNNDGAPDVVSAGGNVANSFLALTATSIYMPRMNLFTAESALEALDELYRIETRVSAEIGSVRAAQTRLEFAYTNAAIMRENFAAAADRITEIDAAFEVAELVRLQVLQQAGTAVLAQANLEQALVLELIN